MSPRSSYLPSCWDSCHYETGSKPCRFGGPDAICFGGLPFDVRVEQPNKETIAAMLEAERISRDPSVKRYSDVEEALRALKE